MTAQPRERTHRATTPAWRRRTRFGFTLLEVMIAVAILAVGLVAYLANQAQIVRHADSARKTALATVLARCKMGEVEEKMWREGLPAVNDSGSDECCEDAEIEGFSCDWKVERVVLPEPSEGGSADGAESSSLSALTKNANGGGTPGDSSSTNVVQSMVAGGGGSDAISAIALQVAYPLIKPSIEEQVRRVTITVNWKEGTAARSFDAIRYLVAEQGAGVPGLPGATPGTPTTPVPTR